MSVDDQAEVPPNPDPPPCGPADPGAAPLMVDEVPESFVIGQDLDWAASWREIELWVELPFWLLVENGDMEITYGDHPFKVAIQSAYFELQGGRISDSGETTLQTGPLREIDDLPGVVELRAENPDVQLLWRKLKTVLKISTRCNEDVLKRVLDEDDIGEEGAARLYLAELCRAHIPVVNALVEKYRLATYDYFPFELSPWDVPVWQVLVDGVGLRTLLVPYRGWDVPPPIADAEHPGEFAPPFLIGLDELRGVDRTASPGEVELLDALNLMERGDYSGAVRRVTTAIEVLVERKVGHAVRADQGPVASKKFLKDSRMNFDRRVKKLGQLTGRKLSDSQKKELKRTRSLRHRIVHGGFRISSGERGNAQRSIDTGRWLYNFVEDDADRAKIREGQLGLRSLGREMLFGIFPSEITSDGVVVNPIQLPTVGD